MGWRDRQGRRSLVAMHRGVPVVVAVLWAGWPAIGAAQTLVQAEAGGAQSLAHELAGPGVQLTVAATRAAGRLRWGVEGSFAHLGMGPAGARLDSASYGFDRETRSQSIYSVGPVLALPLRAGRFLPCVTAGVLASYLETAITTKEYGSDGQTVVGTLLERVNSTAFGPSVAFTSWGPSLWPHATLAITVRLDVPIGSMQRYGSPTGGPEAGYDRTQALPVLSVGVALVALASGMRPN